MKQFGPTYNFTLVRTGKINCPYALFQNYRNFAQTTNGGFSIFERKEPRSNFCFPIQIPVSHPTLARPLALTDGLGYWTPTENMVCDHGAIFFQHARCCVVRAWLALYIQKHGHANCTHPIVSVAAHFLWAGSLSWLSTFGKRLAALDTRCCQKSIIRSRHHLIFI